MAVMFLAVDEITDLGLLREYQAAVGPLLAAHPHQVVAYDEAARPAERTDRPKRVVAIRFESEESFREFYDSDAYQAVIGKRLAGTEGFAVIVNVP
jgi:uncharacterized protein (DUF1330 family)